MRKGDWRRLGLLTALFALVALGVVTSFAPGAELVDLYPREGMVRPGQDAHIEVVVRRPWYDRRPVVLTVVRGLSTRPVAQLKSAGGTVVWRPAEPGGYGIVARLGSQRLSSALDVGENWTERPRYGFLTDFGPGGGGEADDERFAQMARFHLNGLQYYDWHYRHSDYLPPSDQYRDPLGRLLSRSVLQERIRRAHDYGMAAMAYTTVYAAPPAFYQAHPEWGLYDQWGEVFRFGDEFLYLMNPEAGGPWAEHMVAEYQRIVTELDFDGIHLDQFGFPRAGYRRDGTLVDVAGAMADLIDRAKAAVSPRPVFFNDVNAWPLADTAGTAKDAVYIEVWPPHVHFQHLNDLIREGRRRSGGRPVILAAYIAPEREPSVLLTDAVIFASGGYHLEIGEGQAMLHDPYFPNHRTISDSLADHLRRYYDVIVRYQDLLYGKDLQDWEPAVEVEGSRVLPGAYFNGIWPTGRRSERLATLHLINLNGQTDAVWNAERPAPPVLHGREVRVSIEEAPRALWLIDPDGPDQDPRALEYRFENGQVIFRLERLAYWAILAIER